ncbi:uncharacterized protein LOC119080779 [Bradysia coprophila]|uniref:uncharacterized protein LOC119080779 n=1 Tax=Bradysia coprophila TaxID=38358 RepID=UPI00187DC4B3|nr:uncharacterized protein LOC119080779 [Bradysia coprophila]
MLKLISPLGILLLSLEAITAGDISTRCCNSKLEFATKLSGEIDKYEKQYNVARRLLTNIQQDCEIISTMVEYLQTSGWDGSCKSSCELEAFLKSFDGIRSKVLETLKNLRAACNNMSEMAKALGKYSNCKYGYCLLGCANDRNVLECKLRKFVENALDGLYHSNILMDIVERTCNTLGEQAGNFCVKELNSNDSKGQCQINNFLSEFVNIYRPGRESVNKLDINCDLGLSNINQFRAHLAIGSHCC